MEDDYEYDYMRRNNYYLIIAAHLFSTIAFTDHSVRTSLAPRGYHMRLRAEPLKCISFYAETIIKKNYGELLISNCEVISQVEHEPFAKRRISYNIHGNAMIQKHDHQ